MQCYVFDSSSSGMDLLLDDRARQCWGLRGIESQGERVEQEARLLTTLLLQFNFLQWRQSTSQLGKEQESANATIDNQLRLAARAYVMPVCGLKNSRLNVMRGGLRTFRRDDSKVKLQDE